MNDFMNSVFNNVGAPDRKSVERHDTIEGGYNSLTVEGVRKQHEQLTKAATEYDDDKPLGKLLEEHPEIQTCVDIGSGLGWAADLMAASRKKVYAIEPSTPAMRIAQELYKEKNGNIVWMQGFAEEELSRIEMNEPILFNALCVLSHLEDYTVQRICAQVDRAPKGSVLGFSELWGPEHHQPLWHARTQEWWTAVLPTYTLNFIKRPCQSGFKSFTGIKL